MKTTWNVCLSKQAHFTFHKFLVRCKCNRKCALLIAKPQKYSFKPQLELNYQIQGKLQNQSKIKNEMFRLFSSEKAFQIDSKSGTYLWKMPVKINHS